MTFMRTFARAAMIAAAVFSSTAPSLADAPAVQDGAGLFSATTVSGLDQQIGNFTAQSGKQVVVVTVPSLSGATVADAARSVFTSQKVNGVLIFIAKSERRDIVITGTATAAFFPEPTLLSIRQSMEAQFRDGDYDGGITTAVNGILNVFRAHLSSAPAAGNQRSYPVPAQSTYAHTRQGAHFPVLILIILVVVGYLIVRSIFRRRGNYTGGPGMPTGAGYGGGPGYGGYGPGYYGGGGGFWSGLLGGLGGAWLGNEMFGSGGGNIMNQNVGGGMMPMDQGGSWGGGDASGWGTDAGQADMGGASSGDFSGGGFGDMGGDGGGGW
ncbi:MAG TPA: TPM domain-containing protein [Candidatus Lustribacter sp.]